VLGEAIVGLQRPGQQFEALGHVEVDRGVKLAQIGQRAMEQRRRRLAIIDVQRTAVADHQTEGLVAAEGMTPGQPVEKYRILGEGWYAIGTHRQVAAHHALGVDHALGSAGRARGEQELLDRVRADPLARGIDRRGGGRGDQRGPGGADPARQRRLGHHQLDIGRHCGGDGFGEALAVGGEYQAGGQRAQDVAQLRMVLRHQRVGLRH
jgi:hypothetical protein